MKKPYASPKVKTVTFLQNYQKQVLEVSVMDSNNLTTPELCNLLRFVAKEAGKFNITIEELAHLDLPNITYKRKVNSLKNEVAKGPQLSFLNK